MKTYAVCLIILLNGSMYNVKKTLVPHRVNFNIVCAEGSLFTCTHWNLSSRDDQTTAAQWLVFISVVKYCGQWYEMLH